MAKHLLTDRAIRIAKPRATPYRLADGGNLYLLVAPTGAHAWQLRYRLNGKPQTATLGKLAAMSLADARKAAGRARPLADAGEHLTAVKHASRLKRSRDAKTTFASVAADWQKSEARRAQWSADYRAEVEASIRNHLADLDGLPIADITAPIAAPVLRAVEIRAPLMWEKIRSRLRAILDYAVRSSAATSSGTRCPPCGAAKNVSANTFPPSPTSQASARSCAPRAPLIRAKALLEHIYCSLSRRSGCPRSSALNGRNSTSASASGMFRARE
jgi:hypothetical protein